MTTEKSKRQLVFGLVLLIGVVMGIYIPVDDNPLEPIVYALPSQTDIQKLLNQLEPEPRLDVDGRIGAKTIEKWDRVYMREAAKKHDWMYKERKDVNGFSE